MIWGQIWAQAHTENYVREAAALAHAWDNYLKYPLYSSAKISLLGGSLASNKKENKNHLVQISQVSPKETLYSHLLER